MVLNGIFTAFDQLAAAHNVEKIKTIGDAYFAVGGVPDRTPDHAQNVLEFALSILEALETFNEQTGLNMQMRVGINTGAVVAGVIGSARMAFDLWGDAVNVASRMESTAKPGTVLVSATTFQLLRNDYEFAENEKTSVKGKGDMLTYKLLRRRYVLTKNNVILDRRFAQQIEVEDKEEFIKTHPIEHEGEVDEEVSNLAQVAKSLASGISMSTSASPYGSADHSPGPQSRTGPQSSPLSGPSTGPPEMTVSGSLRVRGGGSEYASSAEASDADSEGEQSENETERESSQETGKVRKSPSRSTLQKSSSFKGSPSPRPGSRSQKRKPRKPKDVVNE